MLFVEVQSQESHKTPERLIQEAGVSDHLGGSVGYYRDVFGVVEGIKVVDYLLRGHTPWQGGFCSESLLIEEVAPSAQTLTD